MDSEDTVHYFPPSIKNAYFEDDSYLEKNLDKFSKLDLVYALKEAKNHNADVERSNTTFKKKIEELTKNLNDQYERCSKLEKDKSFLRKNIKKASENWFERKAKLSESENECSSPEPTGAEGVERTPNNGETKTNRRDLSQTIIAEETVQLFADLKYKDEQFQLSEQRSAELSKRVKDYEKVIDDQEVVIHGLEKQLDTYFNDNQKMSKQLADLHKLFLDLEAINEKKVNVPATSEEQEASANEHLPTSEDFKEMSGSVAKTYMKLKELIYEKKSLVTEIERLRTLNVELQNRVSQQELRLMNVSDALQTTWLLVSNLKDEHAKIHTAETIFRYEIKEKREVLNRLKDELECSREQWQFIRQRNSETEQEWANLREELNERRKLRKLAEMNGHNSITQEEIDIVAGACKPSDIEFEPPIDLLVNMGIEYGVVSADDEESSTAIALVHGEDVHENRLQDLEEQCCFLYQKLMTSTARALTLASRLSSIHQHYAGSDEEYEEEEDEPYFHDEEEEDEHDYYETEMLSPDSESHDTAYVSEAEGTDSASGVAEAGDIVNEGDGELNEITREDSSDLDDNADVLSKRLINFLPKKIELLRANNEKLEERLRVQQDEKAKVEDTLNAAIEFERRQRRQLEQQLSHLGKCVDELKLERNGRIAKVEERLKKKIEQVEIEEKDYIQLRTEYETLKENFEEKQLLLQVTTSQLEQATKDAEVKFASLQDEISYLRSKIADEGARTTSTQFTQTDSIFLERSMQEDACDMACETMGRRQEQLIEKPLTSQNIFYESTRRDKTLENTEDSRGMDGHFKQLLIMANCCLRIPFHLPTNSILCWSCYVAPQEILLSIYYNEDGESTKICSSTKGPQEKETTEADLTSQSLHISDQPSASSCAFTPTVNTSRILLKPILIKVSKTPSNGQIIPKVSGQYSVVFQNVSTRPQEVSIKFWVECISSPDEELVSK